jgi:hypothetical protein
MSYIPEPVVYCTGEKQSRHRAVQDREKHEEPTAAGATVKEVTVLLLKSAEGKKIYGKRKETVESVFGILDTVSKGVS